MANVILKVSVILPEADVPKLAPTGELSCVICETCSALVPIYRIVVHDQDHKKRGE